MDLIHIRYDDSCRSKVSIRNVPPCPIGHKRNKTKSEGKIVCTNHVYSSEGTVLMQLS